MIDDEIAERIVKRMRAQYTGNSCSDDVWVNHVLDDAEAYRLAFVSDVRERAAMRRQARRVRAKVFERLGVADRK